MSVHANSVSFAIWRQSRIYLPSRILACFSAHASVVCCDLDNYAILPSLRPVSREILWSVKSPTKDLDASGSTSVCKSDLLTSVTFTRFRLFFCAGSVQIFSAPIRTGLLAILMSNSIQWPLKVSDPMESRMRFSTRSEYSPRLDRVTLRFQMARFTANKLFLAPYKKIPLRDLARKSVDFLGC